MKRYLTLLLAFLSFSIFAAAQLSSVVIQPSVNKTVLTFTLSQKTTGKVKFVPNPNRVIVSLANTKKSFTMMNARLGGSNIESMSTEDTPEGGVNIILAVKEKPTWTIEFIPAENKQNVLLKITIISPVKPAEPVTQPVNPSPPAKSANKAKNSVPVFDIKDENNDENQWIGRSRLETSSKQTTDLFTIVIDAGHGGKDPGAISKGGIAEKNIVLAIAKKVAAEINKNKNMRAILTRSDDYFVPLRARLSLAHKGNADLFIAIHADAYFNNDANGVSVYALSQHGATSEAAHWLAQKENYSELGDVSLDTLKDRSLLLRSVLIDLAQTATIRDSLQLGNNILDALDDLASMHYANVEQAPFVVLKSPDIPSILIETGYLTNPKEEQKLVDPQYQEKIAQAIWRGIEHYVSDHVKRDQIKTLS